MFPVVVSAGRSAARDVDCHSAAGIVDAAGSGCAEGTDHDSTNWVVPGTSAGSLAEEWCMDKYCFQRPCNTPVLCQHLGTANQAYHASSSILIIHA